jgi:hypothetical protein
MPYQVQKLSNEPIILTTLFDDYDPFTEIALSVSDTLEMLDAATEPLTLVLYLKPRLEMQEILYCARLAARGERPTWTHRNTRQVFMVTNNALLSEATRSVTFGVNVTLFGTLEDALACARSQACA